MASSPVGYVSSCDAELGLGYIRPADDPRNIVLFRDSALSEADAACIAAGQQVTYELASTSKASRTREAKNVKINAGRQILVPRAGVLPELGEPTSPDGSSNRST